MLCDSCCRQLTAGLHSPCSLVDFSLQLVVLPHQGTSKELEVTSRQDALAHSLHRSSLTTRVHPCRQGSSSIHIQPRRALPMGRTQLTPSPACLLPHSQPRPHQRQGAPGTTSTAPSRLCPCSRWNTCRAAHQLLHSLPSKLPVGVRAHATWHQTQLCTAATATHRVGKHGWYSVAQQVKHLSGGEDGLGRQRAALAGWP